ncbi:MAG: hypothetical protein ACREID_07045 [Planctomycetota bacterium]
MSVFAGIVGQERAARALEQQLAATGGQGSTLVLGPEGVGRFLLSHAAARSILGTSPAAAARVGACTHADLHLLDDPSRGMDGVRDVLKAIAHRPAEGPRRVLLVRDADGFSEEALNAVLKTLEEPPAGAAIFLVAETGRFLPETVVSRCRIVRARALGEAETVEVLRRHGAPPDAARDAEGSPGRALYHVAAGIGEDADSLIGIVTGRVADPFGEAERIARSRGGEESRARRRRQVETVRVAAARLRRDLPGGEFALRRLLDALGSLAANANPSIVFCDLALTPWRRPANSSPS